MIQTIRKAWSIPELRKKIVFTALILLIFRIGNAIPVPYVDAGLLNSYLQQLSTTVLGLYDVMSGGAFSNATLFALGVQPYINSSIIIQLLTIAIPALERLARDGGEEGKKKIQSITRYATVAIAILQGWGYYALMKTYGIFKGDADGNFNPKSPISRAETATFMVRLIPAYREIADKLAPADEKITFTFENAGETGGLASTLCSDSAVKAVLSGTEAAEALAPGARKAIDVAATFSLNGASVARTYPVYFVRRTGELPASMPTVDDLGAAYCDEATGLKVSKALPIGDENGVILGDGAVGAHGGHESKVLRTRYGVYVLYVTTIYPKPDGYTNASDVFNLIKITDDGCRVIMTGECPRAWGSCLPEVFAGEDGYIYVSVLANLYEKAWLNMYKIDEKTEKVVSEAPLVTDFKLTSANGHATHGYGYSMPIPDIENGKIYGLYTGGAIPGYQAWFIYDIATGKWDKDCRSIQTEYRLGYFMAYADGEGVLRSARRIRRRAGGIHLSQRISRRVRHREKKRRLRLRRGLPLPRSGCKRGGLRDKDRIRARLQTHL